MGRTPSLKSQLSETTSLDTDSHIFMIFFSNDQVGVITLSTQTNVPLSLFLFILPHDSQVVHITFSEAMHTYPPEPPTSHTNIWQVSCGLLFIEFSYQTHFLFKYFIYNAFE